MVNNSTNIYKTNNHLSNQIIEYKKDHDVTLESPGLGQAQTCGGDQPVNDIPILTLLIIWSPTGNIYTNYLKKVLRRLPATHKICILSQKQMTT